MKGLIVLIVLLVSSVAFADINPPSGSFTLNDTTYTAITTTMSTKGRSFGAQTVDKTSWYFSDDLAGTNPAQIAADPGSVSIECRKMVRTTGDTGVLFYAKSLTGTTPTLTLIVAECRNN